MVSNEDCQWQSARPFFEHTCDVEFEHGQPVFVYLEAGEDIVSSLVNVVACRSYDGALGGLKHTACYLEANSARGGRNEGPRSHEEQVTVSGVLIDMMNMGESEFEAFKLRGLIAEMVDS